MKDKTTVLKHKRKVKINDPPHLYTKHMQNNFSKQYIWSHKQGTMASHFQENLQKNIEKSKLYMPQFPLVGDKMKYPNRLSALDQKSSILLTMLGRRKKSNSFHMYHLASVFSIHPPGTWLSASKVKPTNIKGKAKK